MATKCFTWKMPRASDLQVARLSVRSLRLCRFPLQSRLLSSFASIAVPINWRPGVDCKRRAATKVFQQEPAVTSKNFGTAAPAETLSSGGRGRGTSCPSASQGRPRMRCMIFAVVIVLQG